MFEETVIRGVAESGIMIKGIMSLISNMIGPLHVGLIPINHPTPLLPNCRSSVKEVQCPPMNMLGGYCSVSCDGACLDSAIRTWVVRVLFLPTGGAALLAGALPVAPEERPLRAKLPTVPRMVLADCGKKGSSKNVIHVYKPIRCDLRGCRPLL